MSDSSINRKTKLFLKASKLMVWPLSLLLILELLARHSFSVMPIEMHQRYYFDDNTSKNGRGARSRLYEGQPITMAVIGESPVHQDFLSNEKTWTSVLQAQIGQNLIHIDNFGIGYNKYSSMIVLMESLVKQRYQYDIILVETNIGDYDHPLKNTLGSFYSFRWFEENPDACHLCIFAINWIKRRWENDQSILTNMIKQRLARLKHNSVQETDEPESDEGQDSIRLLSSGRQHHVKSLAENEKIPDLFKLQRHFYEHDIRHSSFVKKRLVRVNRSEHFTEEKSAIVLQRIRRIQELANQLGAYLIWAPVRLGYHEQMKESYYDQVITTYRAPDWTANNPKYYDLESYSRMFEIRANENIRLVKSLNIDWVDYMQVIQEKLVEYDDLMFDEYHCKFRCSVMIASLVKEKIDPLVQGFRLKNRNK
jgi:hypothetical protein